MQVYASSSLIASQSKSTKIDVIRWLFCNFRVNLLVRLATQYKQVYKFNLQLLVHYTQRQRDQ